MGKDEGDLIVAGDVLEGHLQCGHVGREIHLSSFWGRRRAVRMMSE
jgi:hypothetical protein